MRWWLVTNHLGLAIDPGLSTGMCLFSFGDDQSFKQERMWQFNGGAGGLARALDMLAIDADPGMYISGEILDVLVVEKFTPRGGPGFSLTQASAEPLRGEGVLIGRGFEPFISWAEPSQQYFMGGTDLAEKKKRSREFLKLHGLYLTGKTVGQKDADDAISAELHAIAWLRRKRHMPTLLALFGPEGK